MQSPFAVPVSQEEASPAPAPVPLASPWASPFGVPQSTAPAVPASPFGLPVYPQEDSEGCQGGGTKGEHEGELSQDVPFSTDSTSDNTNGSLYETPSQITRDYPIVTLPRRNSCDLELGVDDVIMTDQLLGRGGWGEVYSGLYDGLEVAVKIIKWSGNRDELKSLQQELMVLAHLKHPHIVTTYGGSVKPTPDIFLVQELMAGSVSGLIHGKPDAPGRKLSLKEALTFGRDVLRALCFLHEHKVVHRDIKPDNVLLTEDNVVKIGDFGLARFKLNTVLQTKTIDMGTVSHMAPECFDPQLGGVTTAVDIYSFGITLWEMIMGERPYKSSYKDPRIIYQVLQNVRPDLPEPSELFPSYVIDLIKRCWAQQPRSRPTAPEVLKEVEAMINSL